MRDKNRVSPDRSVQPRASASRMRPTPTRPSTLRTTRPSSSTTIAGSSSTSKCSASSAYGRRRRGRARRRRGCGAPAGPGRGTPRRAGWGRTRRVEVRQFGFGDGSHAVLFPAYPGLKTSPRRTFTICSSATRADSARRPKQPRGGSGRLPARPRTDRRALHALSAARIVGRVRANAPDSTSSQVSGSETGAPGAGARSRRPTWCGRSRPGWSRSARRGGGSCPTRW